MTREEASFILANIDRRVCDDELNEALDMAIKALEQQPCEDTIRRADAEALFRNARSKLNPSDYKTADEFNTRDLMLLNAEQFMHLLPSVIPQPKTGHWEQYGNSWEDKFKCSECGKEQPKILCGERIIGHWSDYCPNCGAKMVEPQESEDKE